MSKVSVIVPIYNVENYLRRNLESLRTQTYQDIEVLMINDGSTDNGQVIIDEFEQKDSRFKGYLKENGGLSSARNYGLKLIESEYVMFIDSDDFCEREMIEVCVQEMQINQLDMFVFAYNQYYVETSKKEKINLKIKEGVYSLEKDPSILAYTPNAAWNKMYRTALFKEYDIIYPEGYRHQDLGTTAKLLYLSDKVGYSNQALYNYLIDRPNNITSKVDKKAYHIIDMVKEILDFYQKNAVYKLYYDELNYLSEINLIQSLRKVVTNTNKEFVNQFIDDVFDMKKQYFNKKNRTYKIAFTSKDKIYLNRYLCKMYYLLKK
ncbi:MAG: glycosyltransferase family 2 protein [Erysipelotrichaceae bacterium]